MDLQINRIRQNISATPTSRVVGTGAPMTAAAVAAAASNMQPQQTTQPSSGWGSTNKTLADFVKESAWQNSLGTIGSSTNAASSFSASVIGSGLAGASASAHSHGHHHNSTTSMPWAAAVKTPPDHHHHHHPQQQHTAAAVAAAAAAMSANNFEYNGGSIGSWTSPETSSSNRSGWNADGSTKNADGAFDDGTAIWGNPTTKKTGVDWAEKESLVESSKKTANGSVQNSEKRLQKPETTFSSLNGTEAWGTPISNSQLSSTKINNDNSGNNNFSAPAAKGGEWGEPSTTSSLSSSLQNNERNSSPPSSDCSLWNNLGISKQKSSDWLSSSSGIGGSSGNSTSAGSRLDELNKQLESTKLFDSSSTSSSSSSTTATITKTNSSGSNNPNLDYQSHSTIGLGLGNGSAMGNGCTSVGVGGVGGSGINDLRQQMSANFSNDLLDSPNRHQRQQGVGSNSSASNNNHQSQQLDFSSAAAEVTAAGPPSRDLLKQMVHQIQLAVQAGHLNAHILNQPMSTPTLQLVYQLLQQIKTLNQLQEIQERAGIRQSNMTSAPTNMDVQINKIRQQISILQKAISVQQAALAKNNESSIGGDLNNINKQQANNYSYATISKLSTNSKVPSNNNMSNIITNTNLDSFRRSSLIDTLSNSNSDSLRSAQATFDANATIDKTFSSLIQQASSAVANNILGGNKTTTNQSGESSSKVLSEFDQQADNKNVGLFSAQQSSSSNSAWSAFSSGNNFVSQQAWPSQLRISSNVSQDHNQYSAFDMVPDFGPSKTWRGSSILEDKNNINTNNTSNMAPGNGSNIINLTARPNSASNANKNTSGTALKQQQMKRNDINNRDSSLFCDWGNNSDSGKGNFDQISNTGSNFSNSAIGGLSLQSNPWMFAPTSSSLNTGSGIDRIISKNSSCGDNFNTSNKLDNGNTDKMGGDSSLFLKSSSSATNAAGGPGISGNMQRSSSALYDWGELASTTLQYNVDNSNLNKQQQQQAIGGARPAPPPGLLSNFGPLIGPAPSGPSSMTNGMGSLMDHSNKLLGGGSTDSENAHLQPRETASNLWSSGTWFN